MREPPQTDGGLPELRQFSVLRRLGEGGQGAVYEALDLTRQLRVALKMVRVRRPEHMLRFKDEFRAARDLHHPNLIKLGELLEERGTWFFTMELVDGVDFLSWVREAGEDCSFDQASWPTLSGAPRTPSSNPSATDCTEATAITPLGGGRSLSGEPARASKRRGRLDEARLRQAMRQLGAGLACLHAAGLVHRDLKPSNILVTGSGRVVLIDFGVIAQVADADDERGLVVGTVAYMAPEQVRGEAVTAAADWYAAGVLLFEALTGRRPFEGPTDDVSERKLGLDAPRARDLVGDVPADLDELCARLLDRDPTRRPDAAQVLLALGPGDDDASDSEPALPAAPALFVGRELELERLGDAYQAARARTVAVVLEGESGVGKSAIVQRFLDARRARDRRTLVLRGRCHEQERVPYNAFDAAIDALARELRRLSPARRQALVHRGAPALTRLFPVLQGIFGHDAGVAPLAGSDERLAAFLGLRELLARLARRRRLVLVLDDLQWADRDSLALLEELTREPGAPPLLILATCRIAPGEALPALAAFGGELRRVRVGGLARADAEELARACLAQHDALAGVDPATLLAESSGHPMFIDELVRHLAAAPGGERPREFGLDAALWTRAASLPAAPRTLLEAVAVAGAPIAQAALAAAMELAPEAFAAHVQVLRDARLVRIHGTRPEDAIEPFHARVRESVEARLAPAARVDYHARLGAALAARGASAEVLLGHFDAAGDAARATHYAALAAAAAAATLAFEHAAALYRRALAGTQVPAERRELLAGLGEALARAGRPGEAGEVFAEAARAGAEGPERLDLLRRAAERYLMGGHLAPGLAATRELLAAFDTSLPASRAAALARVVWHQARFELRRLAWRTRREAEVAPRELALLDTMWSVSAGLSFVDTAASTLFVMRGACLALDAGEPFRIARALTAATTLQSSLGRKPRARALLAATLRAAAEEGSERARFYGMVAQHTHGFLVDNTWRATVDGLGEAEKLWRGLGHSQGWEIDVVEQFSFWALHNMGRLRTLARRVPARVHAAQRSGNRFIEVSYRVFFADLLLAEDRAAEARADVVDAITSWLPGSDEIGNQQYLAMRSLTHIALYAGEAEAVADDLGARWKRYFGSLLSRVAFLRQDALWSHGAWLLGRAAAARARGAASEARGFVAAARRQHTRLERIDLPMARGHAARLGAGVAAAEDHPELALTRLRAALALDDATESMLYAACVRHRLGELVGGDEGAELRRVAAAWLAERGVRVPARMIAAHVPL